MTSHLPESESAVVALDARLAELRVDAAGSLCEDLLLLFRGHGDCCGCCYEWAENVEHAGDCHLMDDLCRESTDHRRNHSQRRLRCGTESLCHWR